VPTKRRRPAARSTHVPTGWRTVTPRLFVSDAKRLVAFLKRVFGATGTYQRERPSEITLGDSVIMINDAGIRPPTTSVLYVYVDDVDAVYQRAVAAGARTLEEPSVMPYGDRRCMVEDPWGTTWQIATRLRRRTRR
jgi:PhnB protein